MSVSSRAKHYKLSLVFIACVAVSIFLYVQWVAVRFHIAHAYHESQYLADFTERALSRLRANPDWFTKEEGATIATEGKSFGNHRLNLVLNYAALKAKFPSLPPVEEMQHNHMFVEILNLRGLLKVPDFVIIRPLLLGKDQQYFGYLLVDSQLNDEKLDAALVEELQTVLFIALGSIVLMFLWQTRHINSINNTASALANWADSLNTTNTASPPPNFNVPRLNHIAFTINRSLSTLGDVLEKEQSFAKYTSHELRTPVAALSANIELLEMMMQDLSPKERQVLKRMEVAIADMKYQMEAMLWMSKEIEVSSDFEDVNLLPLIEKSTEDNQYLLKGRNVQTTVAGEDFCVNTHTTLLRIVLNNLIRNAYQNTVTGSVCITTERNTLSIRNQNTAVGELPNRRNESFGIGLVLVEKLVRRLDIVMSTEVIDGGRNVTLKFQRV